MRLRKVSNNTLVDISRLNNKFLKLNKYIIESKMPLIITNLNSGIDESDPVLLIEAFKKDFDSTIKNIKDTYQLLSTVNENHVVKIKNEELNLKEIFGDSYNNKVIDYNYFMLQIGSSHLNVDDIEDDLMNAVLGISKEEFDLVFKQRKKIYKLNRDNLETNDDKIIYLSTVESKNDNIIKNILMLIDEYAELKKSYSFNEIKVIDEKLEFNRNMVDSIIKDSTYISGKTIFQINRQHNINEIIELQNRILKTGFINSVELDKSASVEAVINVFDKIIHENIPLQGEYIFKVRKLGNYNADGLYMDRFKIIAIDVNSPSALIHEITHAMDIHKTMERNDFVNHFKDKMENEDNQLSHYYLNDREIFARLGEINMLFANFDYENDNLNDYLDKKEIEYREKELFDIKLCNSPSFYKTYENVYFNFTKWNKNDFKILKINFANLYESKNLIPLTQEIKNVVEKEKIRRKRKIKAKKTIPVSYINSDNLRKILELNKNEKIIEPEILVKEMLAFVVDLARSDNKAKYTNSKFEEQLEIVESLLEWAEKENNPEIDTVIFESLFYYRQKSIFSSITRLNHIENFINQNYFISEEELVTVNQIFDELDNARKTENKTLFSSKMMELSSLIIDSTFENEISYFSEDMIKFSKAFGTNKKYIELNNSYYSNKTLKSSYSEKFKIIVSDYVQLIMQNNERLDNLIKSQKKESLLKYMFNDLNYIEELGIKDEHIKLMNDITDFKERLENINENLLIVSPQSTSYAFESGVYFKEFIYQDVIQDNLYLDNKLKI